MLSEAKGFLKYSSRTYQANQIFLPCGMTVLMMIVMGLFSRYLSPIEVSSAYTGVVLPLIGGILAAYSTLDDPCLEIQFSTSRSALAMLLSRFALIFIVVAVCSLAYQFFVNRLGIDLSGYGSLWQRQLNWIIPSLGFISLGFFSAYITAQANSGAIAVGMVWILQVIAREWFLMTPGANLFFVFTGALYPTAPTVIASQVVIGVLSFILLGAGWQLLNHQERYI